MSTDRFKKYLPPLLVLGLLAGLVIGFWSFLMTNIVQPVAILFWAIWRVVLSVDQNVYWTILIVACSILVIRFIPSANDLIPHMAYNNRYQLPDRVEHWRILIKDAILGKNESEHLHDGLTKLVASMMDQQERDGSMDLAKMLSAGKVRLSARAQHFLFPSQEKGGRLRITHLLNLSPKWLRKWMGKLIRQDTASINEILEWMEIELEISHDR